MCVRTNEKGRLKTRIKSAIPKFHTPRFVSVPCSKQYANCLMSSVSEAHPSFRTRGTLTTFPRINWLLKL